VNEASPDPQVGHAGHSVAVEPVEPVEPEHPSVLTPFKCMFCRRVGEDRQDDEGMFQEARRGDSGKRNGSRVMLRSREENTLSNRLWVILRCGSGEQQRNASV